MMPLSNRCPGRLRGGIAWLVLMTMMALAAAFASGTPQVMASAPSAAVAEAGLQRDLKAGQAFVAVLIDQQNKTLLAAEAYADWHAYFTQFRDRIQGRFKVYTLSPARGRPLLRHLGKSVVNATLFVNASGHALLHQGLVLEPQVYVLGTAFIETGALTPDAASYGLVEIDLK